MLAFLVTVILLASPIAKYLIEKYDVAVTGRKISVAHVYVNPFTGYVHLGNVVISESRIPGSLNPDSIFLSSGEINARFAILKLFSGTVEISRIELVRPRGIFIQKKKEYNISDLIKKFTPANKKTSSPGFHVSFLGIKITDGEFYYRELLVPVNWGVKKFNLESSGKRWDADTIAARVAFIPATGGGNVKGDFTINFKTKDYRYSVVAQTFDLGIIAQYLRELTNHGCFSANLDASLKATGNFTDQERITASGMLAVNEFHFGKNRCDDLASFDRLELVIDTISPANHLYLFDSVTLRKPYFVYERYGKMDNLQAMFGKNGANITAVRGDPERFNLVIEIARYVKVLAKNFFQSDYRINRMAIYNGDVKFNDFAVSEKFSVDLDPLVILADSIDKHHEWANMTIRSGIRPYGSLALALRVNPKDSTDFDLHYHLQHIPTSVFNPYLITYTSFPVDRGTLELNGNWKVRHGVIASDNHIVIIDPRIGWRRKNKGARWLPMRLVMSLIRERGNVIDYQVPITGNLKDPKFHLHDVIMDLLTNIFVKPATTPYRMEVKTIETEIEKSLMVKWPMRQSTLEAQQVRFIELMGDFLVKNPAAVISVRPQPFTAKEKEYTLFFEAKKRFYLAISKKKSRSFCEEDSEKVDRISATDSLFVHFLEKQANDPLLYTRQEQCTRIIGQAVVNRLFAQLTRARQEVFTSFFRKMGVEKQVRFIAVNARIPFNGFSVYKISYKGEFPESLLGAYYKMNKLNRESPRKKFRRERKNNRALL